MMASGNFSSTVRSRIVFRHRLEEARVLQREPYGGRRRMSPSPDRTPTTAAGAGCPRSGPRGPCPAADGAMTNSRVRRPSTNRRFTRGSSSVDRSHYRRCGSGSTVQDVGAPTGTRRLRNADSENPPGPTVEEAADDFPVGLVHPVQPHPVKGEPAGDRLDAEAGARCLPPGAESPPFHVFEGGQLSQPLLELLAPSLQRFGHGLNEAPSVFNSMAGNQTPTCRRVANRRVPSTRC